ncbi:MAG: peptidase S8 [Bacteroidetes bacterium CG_4_9_14_3_um_filter_41_19]|nr:MAG: peptidase S8 [Bacteroidetes bacterium CG_4_9_14_3_um_filter_41_19]
MTKKLKSIILAMCILAVMAVGAQTVTNVVALHQLAQEYNDEWNESQVRVQQYSSLHHLPITEETSDGKLIQMIDVRDGKPVYYITHNMGAAITTRVNTIWPGGGAGLDLTGAGYDQLGEWDGGSVLTSHQEFSDQGPSRVTVMDGGATHYHSTHVAGTMVAAGVVPSAKGMVYSASLKSWQWSNDNSEMATAAANGLEISNHSYGLIRGWNHNTTNGTWTWYGNANVSPTEDYKFGFYDNDSKTMDQIAVNAPNYLIVRSAGNDRGEGPGNAGQNGEPEKDGGIDGYDCLGSEEVAKNILTVGAVYEVPNYSGSESVVMSSFSCWGPADDGRIKPDIVGKGVDVYSCLNGNNSDYGSLQGTSMSAPNVSGSMAMLQYYYKSLHGGIPMRAATLKGLVLHTADEAGEFPGPDYVFGWGLMNAERASTLITENTQQNAINELVLNQGDVYEREIQILENTDLRITICWTDPVGTPVTAQLDPSDAMLVNDLDLQVVDENNAVFYPYKLDRNNPSAAATNNSINEVDNVEMVFAEDLAAGPYTIRVSHGGTLQGNQQAFSMIITGLDEYAVIPECSNNLKTPLDGDVNVFLNQWISWNPALFASSYDVFFGTDGGGIATPVNTINGTNFSENGFSTLMQENTTYYLQVIPRNIQGTAISCNEIWSFTTMPAINSYPFTESVEDVTGSDLPEFWQSLDNSDANWISTNLIGHTGNNAMACWNPKGLVLTEYNNWLISLPFRVEEGKEYNVSYFYHSFLPTNPETLSLYWGFSPDANGLTHLLFEGIDFFYPEWLEGSGLLIPNADTVVFLGWHLSSPQGYGIFMDDVMVEDWGTVGISQPELVDEVKMYSRNNQFIVEAGSNWDGARIRVMNLYGQTLYSENYTSSQPISFGSIKGGIYLVSIQKGNKMETRKIGMF